MASQGIFKHIRNYFSASMLAALAGIITFPLLTRSLTVAEYGILGLITSSASLFLAFGKLGAQQALIRFYSQIKNKNILFSINELNSTAAMMFVTFATITTSLWVLTGFTLLPLVSDFENITQLAMLASGLVFVRMLGSGVLNYLQAQQRSAVVGFTLVLNRYLNLIMIVGIMILFDISVLIVLLSMLIAEIVGIGFATKKFWPDFSFKPREINLTLGKAMVLYGVPLMMSESLGLVMRLSDRYIIQAMLGENALGMYSASYNLTAYLDIVILATLMQALKPYYMQLWETEGAEPTQDFLSNGLRTYIVVGIPLITLFSLISPHLLSFLASDKYSPGTIIIPFVAFSFLLEGASYFLAAGLYIKKNTKTLMLWGVLATVLNLGLNIVVIPIYGILGAAVITILSFSVYMLGVGFTAFKFLPFEISARMPLLITLLSLIVYALLFKLDFGSDFSNLVIKGLLGGLALSSAVMVVDRKIREIVLIRLRSAKTGTVE